MWDVSVTMKPRGLLISLGIGLSIILLLLKGFWGVSPQTYQSDTFLMDTFVTIKLYGQDSALMKKAADEAFAEMRRISALTDRYDPGPSASTSSSDIVRINAQAGIAPVVVDADIFQMLRLAKEYDVFSEGAFNVTIGPLVDAWGFGQDVQKVPSTQDIEQALSFMDSSKLILDADKQTAYLATTGMSLDLGAIAKGYATEKAASIIEQLGITEGLIDAGGNIRVIGQKNEKTPWSIGIQDPRNAERLIAILRLVDESAVTSGDYNRYFTVGETRYHHLLSPYTGAPARENMSVTVLAHDAALADMLSTAFFVLKAEKVLALAEKLEGVEVFVITADRRILMTPGLEERIDVTSGEGYLYEPSR